MPAAGQEAEGALAVLELLLPELLLPALEPLLAPPLAFSPPDDADDPDVEVLAADFASVAPLPEARESLR
jgi:hypothetical protein